MNNTYLYKYDSKSNIRQWKGWIEENEDGTATIKLEYGLKDGKLQIKERLVSKGKNIGKSNETTVLEQAKFDLESLYQKQLDDGYVYNIEDYVEPLRPMLAHKYQDKAKNVVWSTEELPGLYNRASPKYNGIRCFIIIDDLGNIKFESRTGKPFKDFLHIKEKVNHLKNVILDGELFNPDVDFEKICSYVNSEEYTEETDNLIQFFIYDFIDLDNKTQIFEDRLILLFSSFSDPSTKSNEFYPVKLVEQTKVFTEEEMDTLHDKWVSEGYEGLMLKNPDGSYEFGKRSNNLLKYKKMLTEEFKIKDIFLADNDDTRVQIEFYVNPFEDEENTFKVGTVVGSKEENLEKYFKNKDTIIGKWMTVQFQNYSAYGVPMFPQALALRDGEEIDNKFVPDV